MKALSIQQPWAWLIVNGDKDIENRTWRTQFRGPFLIHASKKFDENGYQWLWTKRLEGYRHIPEMPNPDDKANMPRGGVVGWATLADCVTESDSPWFEEGYGFVLADAERTLFQRCKGALGFFECDADCGRDERGMQCWS